MGLLGVNGYVYCSWLRAMRGIREKNSIYQHAVGRSGAGVVGPDSAGSPIVACSVIVVSTVLVYSNTFDASFQYDDIRTIVLNEEVRDLRNLWPPLGRRFMGYLSFALNYRIGGLSVFGFHLANLVIHVCSALLVFWFARVTLRVPALRHADAGPLVRRYLPLAAGLLFAVHPVQTQAVTYIVQRFASLATLFFLLSLTLYAQARLLLEADRPSKARAACLYCLSALAAVAAMKTKEISFTLPFVAAGYEWLFFRPRRRLFLVAPLAAIALLLVPLGLLTHGQKLADVLSDSSHFATTAPEIPRSVYLLTQSRVVVTYLRLLLLPTGQNLDYDFRLSYSLADPSVLFALAVLASVAVLAVLLLRRAHETNRAAGALFFFGVAWFFVTLSIESSVIPIRDVINEHRVYLPSVGAAIALGTALLCAAERARSRVSLALRAALALLITAGPLGAAAYARNFVWKDEVTLWSDVVAKSPRKPRGHEALGLAYLARGATSEAVDEFVVVLEILPGFFEGPGSHGDAHEVRSQQDAAHDREAVRRELALRIGPARARDANKIGEVYEAYGQLDDAMRTYSEAIRLDSSNAEAHMNLARVLDARGQIDDAVREYREAIRLDPSMAAAHMNLGTAYYAKGQIEDAMSEYREAIRIDPSKAGAHVNLGAAYHRKGQIDDAIREYREAIRLDSSMAEAHNNLGAAYEAKGQLDDAAREYREATRLDSSTGRKPRRLWLP